MASIPGTLCTDYFFSFFISSQQIIYMSAYGLFFVCKWRPIYLMNTWGICYLWIQDKEEIQFFETINLYLIKNINISTELEFEGNVKTLEDF